MSISLTEKDWQRLQEELQKARLEAQQLSLVLSEAWDELTLLYDLAEQLRGLLDIQKVVHLIAERTRELMDMEGVAVMLKEPEGEWNIAIAFCSPDREEWLRASWGKSIADSIVRQGKGTILNDLFDHPRWGSIAAAFGIANIVAVPLNPKGHMQGVLVVWNKRQGDWMAGELKLLSTIAAQGGGVIESAYLFQQLQETFHGTISALASAVDAKSRWTAGHSHRVTQFALQLAADLGFTEQELQQVHLSGLLHDIGKVGVPDAILDKPGPLSDEEWTTMKRHPVIGYEILKNIRQFHGPILDGVLYHHERVDGKGYPLGLKGKDIPLIGRLLSVADGFDAMTSDRPYRAGMPVEKALQILTEGAGTQWDRELALRFVALQKRKE